jgi:hypothetical protein
VNAEKWARVVIWWILVAALPLVVYVIGYVIAALDNRALTLDDLLELGDILLIVLTLLALSMSDLVFSLMVKPRPGSFTYAHLLDVACFLFALVSLIFLASVYGRVLLSKIQGGSPIPNKEGLFAIYRATYGFYVVFCGGINFRMVLTERLA